MTNQEAIDREIYAQSQIIKDDEAGVRSPRTSTGDRLLLRMQIEIRTALYAALLKRREKLSFIA